MTNLATQGVYFTAEDSSGNIGLWVTSGTSAGTYEIGGAASAGVTGALTAFDPEWLTAFHGKVLFSGLDSLGGAGLWISDGTAAGTIEIGGAKDAGVVGAYQGTLPGLHPGFPASTNLTFVVFGPKALFFGWDTAGDDQSIWVTDGTAAGTIELGGLSNAGISGAYALGLGGNHFVAIGNKVVFNGYDSHHYEGLWVTDGTTGGTVEIGGLNNAGVTGASASVSLNPQELVAIGSKALFIGKDASGIAGLWVTDGTAAGTFEIGGSKSAGVAGADSNGLAPGNVTAFGYNKALFSGWNGATPPGTPAQGLWITDGTTAGTHEIGGMGDAGVVGANSGLGLAPVGITAFGNHAVFSGADAKGYGNYSASAGNLWVTDGTASGTIEIGGIQNAGLANVNSTGLNPIDFAAIGSKDVFEGVDASGLDALWVTDGTLAGTFEIGGLNNSGVAGAPAGGLFPAGNAGGFTVSGNQAYFEATNRSNGNSVGLWVTDGTVAGTHLVTNSAADMFSNLSDALDLTPTVSATPDTVDSLRDNFNGDGKSDLLLENTSGAVYVGEVKNGSESYMQVAALGPEWSFKGNGDFLGDGHEDFLIENINGAVYVGEVKNGTTTYMQAGGLGSEWKFVGTGDFLNNGQDQFLIENTSGAVFVGNVVNGSAQYTQVAALGPEWSFRGAGDFLGDGETDFLIENAPGAVYVGEVKNGATNYTQVGALGPEWKFVGTGDFLGNGQDQFLIENSSGALDVANVVNGQAHYTQVGALGPEWSFLGTGDYLGTGTAGFMIENTAGALVLGTIANGQASYTQAGALGKEWTSHW